MIAPSMQCHDSVRGLPLACEAAQVSYGSPETALNGSQSFGYLPADGESDADLARQHTEVFRAAIAGTKCRRQLATPTTFTSTTR